ncbi:hypothetical protein EMIHUDRAFT_202520 [Emiliania huxleyi CCMP1516]|uniref:XPG N-terminal domain-containing protein n=2 Tax=Emiliania huxleyi TaxID=2903 RepID=A0A0D3K8B5_EMIH1|nr:hypothetical protein EMIHUDRAFT_202520 [Emiliania huxleyi CCMP1516]EOD32000.1 hypothetical protein EMIHUDRAFT_202520 [Emiliania huxleyi CCMP1516]|eukprot:XP_005784429.1 hypothetical protein EMIHUDRAFT_202520 [Emiliania huxleyi CCMP1516]
MGVHNLWDLLAPCGRRCSIDSLARKRLAVDASIWLIQFIKAMRDVETGEMLHNAPQLGLFRRLCKLLFLHAAVARLPPALQFEVLDEIKLAERNRRRDELVRADHDMVSFSHAQLENYVEVSKACRLALAPRTAPRTGASAGAIVLLRESLNEEAAQSRRRIIGDSSREYAGGAGDADSADSAAASGGGFFPEAGEAGGAGIAAPEAEGEEEAEEQSLARALALSPQVQYQLDDLSDSDDDLFAEETLGSRPGAAQGPREPRQHSDL